MTKTQYTVIREIYSIPSINKLEIKRIEDWKNVEFQSSSGLTEEFAAFAKMYRTYINKMAKKEGLQLVSWNRGHFYCSGFLKNANTGKLAYFSCSDVRFLSREWLNNILIRTAQHDKDYTGGQNNFCSLDNMAKSALNLTAN